MSNYFSDLGAVALDPEVAYGNAFKSGVDSKKAFQARCAGYGYTQKSKGTSWDDICIGHEMKNKLGPVYGSSGKSGSWFEKNKKIVIIGGAVAAGALVLLLIAR